MDILQIRKILKQRLFLGKKQKGAKNESLKSLFVVQELSYCEKNMLAHVIINTQQQIKRLMVATVFKYGFSLYSQDVF